MKLVKYVHEIRLKELQVEELNKEIDNLKSGLALRHHPKKVGSVCECSSFSHKGKSFRVDRAWVSIRMSRMYFCASGPLFKKDGKLGKNTGRWEQEIKEYTE